MCQCGFFAANPCHGILDDIETGGFSNGCVVVAQWSSKIAGHGDFGSVFLSAPQGSPMQIGSCGPDWPISGQLLAGFYYIQASGGAILYIGSDF